MYTDKIRAKVFKSGLETFKGEECNVGHLCVLFASMGRYAPTVQKPIAYYWPSSLRESVAVKKTDAKRIKNKPIKDGGSTAALPPNNKQKDHQSN